jgi:hypothetical protein
VLLRKAANAPEAPKPAPYPVQRALSQAMRDAATKAGDIDRMQAWAGQAARLATTEPAGDLVRRPIMQPAGPTPFGLLHTGVHGLRGHVSQGCWAKFARMRARKLSPVKRRSTPRGVEPGFASSAAEHNPAFKKNWVAQVP